jgi:hypothetical protein
MIADHFVFLNNTICTEQNNLHVEPNNVLKKSPGTSKDESELNLAYLFL